MIDLYEIPFESRADQEIPCWYIGRFPSRLAGYLEAGNPNEGCRYIVVEVEED